MWWAIDWTCKRMCRKCGGPTCSDPALIGDDGRPVERDPLNFEHGNFIISAPLSQIVTFIEDELEDFVPLLKAIMESYDPPLSADDAWALVTEDAMDE